VGQAEPIKKFEKAGALAFDAGAWLHTPLTEPFGSKVRWWGGLGYKYKSLSAGVRLYAGTPLDGNYGMLAEAVYAKAVPVLAGPLSAELSYFGVLNETYLGEKAPIDSAAFHVGTVGLPLKAGTRLEIKPQVQIWHIRYQLLDGSKTNSTHLQLGAEGTMVF